jgi:hypothetical protein
MGSLPDQRLFLIVLVPDLPDQLLQEILQGHQAGGAPVLVDDDGQVEPLGLKLAKERVRPL